MEINLYQIIGIVISLPLLFWGTYKFISRERGQTLFKFLANFVVWGGILVVSVFPQIVNDVAGFLGIKGAVNGIIFLAFLILFILVFRILRILERLEENLTTVIRRLALKDLKKKK